MAGFRAPAISLHLPDWRFGRARSRKVSARSRDIPVFGRLSLETRFDHDWVRGSAVLPLMKFVTKAKAAMGKSASSALLGMFDRTFPVGLP
jgi:hypothetical protein